MSDTGTRTDPRANLGKYPSDPHDVKTGRLAALYEARADRTAYLQTDRSADTRTRKLEAQLAGYQAAVKAATPESDMAAVAAAAAGIGVCERALIPLRVLQSREQDTAEQARREFNEGGSTYRRLLTLIPEAVMAGRPEDARRLRRDLEELAGPPPPGA